MAVETFGKRICRLRKQANMTQRELANYIVDDIDLYIKARQSAFA